MRLLAKNNWLAGQSINNGYSRVEEQEETKDDSNGGWPECHIIKMLFNLRQCLFPHLWFNQAEDVPIRIRVLSIDFWLYLYGVRIRL